MPRYVPTEAEQAPIGQAISRRSPQEPARLGCQHRARATCLRPAQSLSSVTSWQWPTSPRPGDSAKPDPRDGLLPLFLVEHEGKEERFYSEKERHDYFAAHNLHVDVEAELESGSGSATALLSAAWLSLASPALFHQRPSRSRDRAARGQDAQQALGPAPR